MLLDEVFNNIARTTSAWVRKDGKLQKVSKDQAVVSVKTPHATPMFPIKSPRYE